jgi:hypothetical protein
VKLGWIGYLPPAGLYVLAIVVLELGDVAASLIITGVCLMSLLTLAWHRLPRPGDPPEQSENPAPGCDRGGVS